MATNLVGIVFGLLATSICVSGYGIRSDPIPADHVIYAAHNRIWGSQTDLTSEDRLPRTFIHSIFKFGLCTPEVIQRVYLAKKTNITLSDWQSTQAAFIYLLETENTQRFRFQCIVMKILVPRKYLFRGGRFPLYYCQGTLRYVYLLTYQKIQLHEWYFQRKINMPAILQLEFYHPPSLDFLHVHHHIGSPLAG